MKSDVKWWCPVCGASKQIKYEGTTSVVKEQIIEIYLNDFVIDEGVEKVRVMVHTGARRPKSLTFSPYDFEGKP